MQQHIKNNMKNFFFIYLLFVITFTQLLIIDIKAEAEKTGGTTEKQFTEEVTNYKNQCNVENCTESNACSYIQPEGCILVTENNIGFIHNINLQNESSVVFIELVPTNETEIFDGHISIEFFEFTIMREKWLLMAGQAIKNIKHVSQKSNLEIHFDAEGNWNDIILKYKEYKFETEIREVSFDTGWFKPLSQRANTLTLYNLTPLAGKWNDSSVMITVQYLNVDEISGEYVLIGSGKEPFVGPPPVFITREVSKPEKYYVVSEKAYILFFARSPNEKTSKFKIDWERSGERLREPEEEVEDTFISDKVLQAVQICFYNNSIIQELNCTKCSTKLLSKFREKFAEIATEYAKEMNFQREIKEKDIQLFRVSAILDPDSHYPNGLVYVMISAVQEYDYKTAIFRWAQMQEVLERYERYDKKSNHTLLGFKVGKCPSGISYTSWYTATALLVLFCILLVTGVWICTYNMIWKPKKSGKNMSNVLSRINMKGMIPKIRPINNKGDSSTISYEEHYDTRNTNENDDFMEFQTVINDNWIIGKKPEEDIPKLTARELRIWKDCNTEEIMHSQSLNSNTNTESLIQRPSKTEHTAL